MPKIISLVGVPSIGKSTWIENNSDKDFVEVISNDDVRVKAAAENRITYDETFLRVDESKKNYSHLNKYGNVVEVITVFSPKTGFKVLGEGKMALNGNIKLEDGTFLKKEDHEDHENYSSQKMYEAQAKAAKQISDEFGQNIEKAAKSGKDIIIDMTNMNEGSRQSIIKQIKAFNPDEEFELEAVDFKVRPENEIYIRLNSQLRSYEAKDKTIPDEAYNGMYSSYKEPTIEEGYGSISVENQDEIMKKVFYESYKKRRSKSTLTSGVGAFKPEYRERATKLYMEILYSELFTDEVRENYAEVINKIDEVYEEFKSGNKSSHDVAVAVANLMKEEEDFSLACAKAKGDSGLVLMKEFRKLMRDIRSDANTKQLISDLGPKY